MDHPEPLPAPVPPNRARRIAAIAAGLAVLVGAVLLLRTPPEEDAGPTTPPVPPPQTAVKQFAADGVVVPTPGGKPEPPSLISISAGPQRLKVRWLSDQTKTTAGYDVRWGRMGTMEYSRLVALPSIQLDGLDNNTAYDIEVRAVDSYGQRSAPTKATGTPQETTDDPPWSFNDRFTSRVVPDPAKWQLASSNGCGKATSGEGEDGRRLVISAKCGTDPVALRARPLFTLRDTPVNGEYGRFVVETDHVGLGGILTLDLVPGPADLIGGPTADKLAPNPSGSAADDPALPPGAIRVWIAAQGDSTTDVGVLVAPGTPRNARGSAVGSTMPPEIGVSVRWEVVFTEAGIQVLQNGSLVGAANVLPAWREATALVGFVGARGSTYAAVSLVGFIGAPTTVPTLVVPPPVDAGRVVVPPEATLITSATGTRLSGNKGAQVRAVLVPQNRPGDATADTFSIEVGGAIFPARPAVPGQPMSRGVRYPIVADVPPEALVLGDDGKTLPLQVRGPLHRGQAATAVVNVALELTAPDGAVSPAAGSGTDVPLPRPKPALPEPGITFFAAAGNLIQEGANVPRGRMVIEVSTDGFVGQQVAGRLAGTAGVEVRLDGQRIAGIPTIVDGPGVGGRWTIALPNGGLKAGRHTFEVKVLGTDETAIPALAYASFQLAD
ncbi:hypothetical protein JOD54_001511 [Actinokineospora baliensis]|uniref:fibronectin type III domain-containing protein n=1 Tax=Actinokineospora baliensis TaxID=547056 RepID=UPI00195D6CFC|nr:fibronectin type III domain-containing protein [Actinokineospora baliensis]MBM7771307.1 hypothetical protein [Actinokineospora baliensis]